MSSNTSGLSIRGMVEGRSEDFRQHFLVTHFFNPVRYMCLLEIVAGEDTVPRRSMDLMATSAASASARASCSARTRPTSSANRIGVFGMMATIQAMMEMDYQVDEVDAITGPAMGHP